MIKGELSNFKTKIELLISKADQTNIKLLQEKIKLEHFILKVKTNIFLLEHVVSMMKVDLKLKNSESNEMIDKLNKFKEQLLETNEELEGIKTKIIEFKHYEGKIRSSLCNNSEYKVNKNCETPIPKTK